MTNLQNLDLQKLKDLLSWLKLYEDMSKKLWNRWKSLFKRNLYKQNNFLVEFYPSISQIEAYNVAREVYKKSFNIEVPEKNIKFSAKESILWWIKVYKDDSMVDLSFSKVENIMRK